MVREGNQHEHDALCRTVFHQILLGNILGPEDVLASWNDWRLDLADLVRSACRAVFRERFSPQAVGCSRNTIEAWLDNLETVPEWFLQAGKAAAPFPEPILEFRKQMLRVFLLCTKALLEPETQWVGRRALTKDRLKTEQAQLGAAQQEVPFRQLGFWADLVDDLTSEGRLRERLLSESVVALLVEEGGVAANLTVECLPSEPGAGPGREEPTSEFYPHPDMAFTWCQADGDPRDNFVLAAETACHLAADRVGWERFPQRRDVRWQLVRRKRRDGSQRFQALRGNSAGGAFALGLTRLLARAMIQPLGGG